MELTRRSFLGTIGAAAATIPVINVAHAAEGSATETPTQGAPGNEGPADAGQDLSGISREELLALVKDAPVATEDLTLPDGTVIDKTYVTLRNRLNRIGEGFGGTPGPKGYDFFTALWTLEEAEAENEMPLLEWFTAYDYATLSGRELDEATELCDRLANKRLICRVDRGGTDWYYVFCGLYGTRAATRFREVTKEFITNAGNVAGIDDAESQFPIFGACPVSADVVEGGKIAPFRDWRGTIERAGVIGVAPCGCRNWNIQMGAMEENDNYHGILHCLVTGETAEYMIETGNAVQISCEEALDIYDHGIEDGFVPEMAYTQHPEVLCLCKSETCAVLGVYRALNGQTSKLPNASAYVLSYDAEKCIGCGACVERCPMATVTLTDDGHVELGPICVGCGQCVLTCPAGARILREKPVVPPLPSDYLDLSGWQSADRLATVGIHDFMGTEIPQEAIDATGGAYDVIGQDDGADAASSFLIDQKPTGGAESYEDGTYQADVVSIGGPMAVEVKVAAGRISQITVKGDHDTPSIGEAAMRVLSDRIIGANGLDVDTVSLATHSSIALMRGVEDCMRQAGWDGTAGK